MAVKDWSTTPSANALADADEGVSFPEGQAPGTINDSVRAMMAVIKGDFANSLTGNGYQKLPNGLILQWMKVSGPAGSVVGTWPIPFPNAVLHAQASVFSTVSNAMVVVHIGSVNTTGIQLVRLFDSGGSTAVQDAGEEVYVFGIGS
jgi:hypothetical protein